jgi:hypothetical protein
MTLMKKMKSRRNQGRNAAGDGRQEATREAAFAVQFTGEKAVNSIFSATEELKTHN